MKTLITILILSIPLIGYSQSSSISINQTNGKTTMKVKTENGANFSLEYEGEITLSDDDSDVIAISDGGFMEIKKSAFGSRRRVYIEEEGGRLVKTYYVGTKEVPFSPEGQKWMAEILLEVVRTTTLGSEKRVDRLFANGGATAVVNEVKQINSDHVKSQYLKLLLNKNLRNEDYIPLLEEISDIDSDHHKADILKYNMNSFLRNKYVTTEYIKTVGSIDSDHHKAEILKTAVRSELINDDELEPLCSILDEIESDHHKADIIREILRTKKMNPRNIDLVLKSADEINSDHHKADLLKIALSMPGISESGYELFLDLLDNIDSDHHRADILLNMLDEDLSENELDRVLMLVTEDVNSEHQKSEVLRNIINNQQLTPSIIEKLIRANLSMDSSHLQGETFRSFNDKKLSEASLVNILNAIKFIDSDHTISEVLISFSPTVRSSSNQVKEAYRKAADEISSDHSKERALNAIK
ncbi:hypothetical protein [Portibacter lacus]|nr:hypothetical protein [Portibacter lacus]